MGLTDAEIKQLQEAIDAGDQLLFENLLASFINARKITQAEAQEVAQYAMPTSTTNTTAQFRQPFTPADTARFNAAGLDPDILTALKAVYTSPTDLADRLGLLVLQKHITVSSAGKYYNTILGIKPTSTLLGETNQADIDRKAQMYVNAGIARVEASPVGYTSFDPNARKPLSEQQTFAETQATKSTDLATRQDNLKQAWATIYSNPATRTPSFGSYLDQKQKELNDQTQAYLAGGSDQILQSLKQLQSDVTNRADRQAQLDKALLTTQYNPLLSKEEKATIAQWNAKLSDDYISGRSDQLANILIDANNNAKMRSASEGQTADALIAMLNRKEPATALAPRPNMPDEFGVAEGALAATGLGEGTKLRNFIAARIAETAQNLRPNRLAWWQRRTAPPEPEEKTYEDVVGALTGESEKWKTVAENAPSSEVAGNTAYGVGGLKAIAEKAYAEAQGRLGKLNPADFPTRTPRPAVTAEEDPLTTALKGRKWWEEYARMPGAGTVPRLQRAVRFR